jgi:hypothetical protein
VAAEAFRSLENYRVELAAMAARPTRRRRRSSRTTAATPGRPPAWRRRARLLTATKDEDLGADSRR